MTRPQYLPRPSREEMRALPLFTSLRLGRIHQVRTSDEAEAAHAALRGARHVGFDTESKPTFAANQAHTGPHLVQLATPSAAFLFPLTDSAGLEVLREVLESGETTKVGFGLKSDRGPLHGKLGISLHNCVELAAATRRLGYRDQVGLQAAVAIVLGQYLQKSRKVTTSNWASENLTDAQCLYAANDAYASLCVYLELLRSAPQVLVAAPGGEPSAGAGAGRRRRRGR